MSKMLMAAVLALTLADSAPNITGTWNMGVQGGHVVPVALVLKQDGKTVTGTIAMPTQHVGERLDIALTGTLDGAALTLSGKADEAAEPTTIEIAGKLLEDGTMEGAVEVVMGKGTHRANWTAERLKERKPQ
jgi:hypothetical protein